MLQTLPLLAVTVIIYAGLSLMQGAAAVPWYELQSFRLRLISR